MFDHIPELSFVYLGPNKGNDARWRVTQVYETPILSKEKLIEKIQNKDSKCDGYEECDSYWLLVAVDFFDRAQDQTFPNGSLEGIKSDKFEKIWVYKTIMNQLLELK